MNDNYLWNRSGDPDPEVQELEEILGTLRYRPTPLKLPAHILIPRSRNWLPPMAIAAGLALLVLSVLWFHSEHLKRPQENFSTAATNRSDEFKGTATTTAATSGIVKPNPGSVHRVQREKRAVLIAANKRQKPRADTLVLTPQEQANKDQLLLALRLASFKLGFAQRKSQVAPQVNAIRNQHKIG